MTSLPAAASGPAGLRTGGSASFAATVAGRYHVSMRRAAAPGTVLLVQRVLRLVRILAPGGAAARTVPGAPGPAVAPAAERGLPPPRPPVPSRRTTAPPRQAVRATGSPAVTPAAAASGRAPAVVALPRAAAPAPQPARGSESRPVVPVVPVGQVVLAGSAGPPAAGGDGKSGRRGHEATAGSGAGHAGPSRLPGWGAPLPPAPAAAPAVDVAGLADQVLATLDRRLISRREREGMV
jgi:hypothetical protein